MPTLPYRMLRFCNGITSFQFCVVGSLFRHENQSCLPYDTDNKVGPQIDGDELFAPPRLIPRIKRCVAVTSRLDVFSERCVAQINHRSDVAFLHHPGAVHRKLDGNIGRALLWLDNYRGCRPHGAVWVGGCSCWVLAFRSARISDTIRPSLGPLGSIGRYVSVSSVSASSYNLNVQASKLLEPRWL